MIAVFPSACAVNCPSRAAGRPRWLPLRPRGHFYVLGLQKSQRFPTGGTISKCFWRWPSSFLVAGRGGKRSLGEVAILEGGLGKHSAEHFSADARAFAERLASKAGLIDESRESPAIHKGGDWCKTVRAASPPLKRLAPRDQEFYYVTRDCSRRSVDLAAKLAAQTHRGIDGLPRRPTRVRGHSFCREIITVRLGTGQTGGRSRSKLSRNPCVSIGFILRSGSFGSKMVRDVGKGDPALLAFAGAKVMNREPRVTNQQLADWIREVRGRSRTSAMKVSNRPPPSSNRRTGKTPLTHKEIFMAVRCLGSRAFGGRSVVRGLLLILDFPWSCVRPHPEVRQPLRICSRHRRRVRR